MLPVGFRSIIGGLIEAEGSLYVPSQGHGEPSLGATDPHARGPTCMWPPAGFTSCLSCPWGSSSWSGGVLRSVNWGQGGGEEGLGQSCIWVRGCAKSAHPTGCCQARICPFKCPSRCRDLWNQEPRASLETSPQSLKQPLSPCSLFPKWSPSCFVAPTRAPSSPAPSQCGFLCHQLNSEPVFSTPDHTNAHHCSTTGVY